VICLTTMICNGDRIDVGDCKEDSGGLNNRGGELKGTFKLFNVINHNILYYVTNSYL
jgi:hypothetical protein